MQCLSSHASSFKILILYIATLCVVSSNLSVADELTDFESSLTFRTGKVDIGKQLATLDLGDSFRFVGARDAHRILTEAWGNPEEESDEILGMIFPNTNGLAIESWGVVVSYEEDGYVRDSDAEQIDYEEMANDLKRSTRLSNPQRVKDGYPEIEFVGWAEPPHYDKQFNKLYWAKEFKFGNDPTNSINYDIRILGRKGVLVLSAIAARSDLERLAPEMERLLPMVEFKPGAKYSDFAAGDRIAEYGIAALVAGTVATKAGVFKWLLALILAAKKYLLLLLFGAGAALKKFFSKEAEVRPESSQNGDSQK